jgi:hypothetical protein
LNFNQIAILIYFHLFFKVHQIVLDQTGVEMNVTIQVEETELEAMEEEDMHQVEKELKFIAKRFLENNFFRIDI